VSHGKSKGAKAVQDGLREATNGRHGWINVQWVAVTVEAIHSSLISGGLVRRNSIGCSLRYGQTLLMNVKGQLHSTMNYLDARGCACASKTANATNEGGELIHKDNFTARILGDDCPQFEESNQYESLQTVQNDDSALSLVKHVDESRLRDQFACISLMRTFSLCDSVTFSRKGLKKLHILLAMQQHHRVELESGNTGKHLPKRGLKP
jgi:hypothetical protein